MDAQGCLSSVSPTRATEERLRLALDGARVGTYHWDMTTDEIVWSETYRALFGLPPDAPASFAGWLDCLLPENRERCNGLVRQAMLGHHDVEFDYPIRWPDGSAHWISGRGRFYYAEDGTPLRMEGVVSDITARKEAERALQASEELAREQLAEIQAYYDTAPVGLFVLDTALRYRRINRRLAAINGTPVAAHLGRTVREVLPWLADHVEPLFRRVIDTGEPLLNVEVTEGDDAGRKRVWRADYFPLRNAAGTVIGINGMAEDITEQRAMEDQIHSLNAGLEREVEARTAELRTLNERLQLATAAGGIGVWELDLQTGKTTWDARLRAMHGLPEGQPSPCQSDWLTWLEPQDRVQIEAAGAKIIAGVEAPQFSVVFQVNCPDGVRRSIASQGRLIRDDAGVPRSLIGVNWDVTAERQAAAALAASEARARAVVTALREARDAAEQAARAKTEFLAHMSHELRTPMNSVLGLAQVLERTPLDADQRAMLAQVRAAGRSLLHILDDILDLSKIEAGQLAIDLRPFALAPVLSAVDDLFGTVARDKGLAFTIAAPPALTGCLLGDPMRLEQVLVNLVGNAVKFTAAGEVSVRSEPVECAAGSVRLRFSVSDTGIGIAPETLAGLFTPFSQADQSITRRYGGTGLGLAICKRLVEAMGGAIGAESQPGVGSTFWFEIPFELGPASSRPESAACPPAADSTDRLEAGPTGPRLVGARLLVVDDSAMNRVVIERMLALEGARVTQARDGREAVERLQAEPHGFDAALMDVQMPVMDGLTATRLIRTDLGLTALPVIALTAGVLQSQQEAALAAGMNDVLTKPLDLERMVALLLRWVRPMPAAPTAPAAPTRGAREPAAAFPEIPGIDRAVVADRLAGNRALFIELLERFADESAALVAAARRDLAAADHQTAMRRLHTLKGHAGTLGALDLMEAAARLEAAIDRGEPGLDEQLAALATAIGALVTASAPWCAAPTPPSAPAPGAAAVLDPGALAQFREALSARDLRAIADFEALRPGLFVALGAAGCDRLGRAIQQLEFAQALALLDQAGMA